MNGIGMQTRTVLKYALLQLPSALVLLIVLLLLRQWFALPSWLVWTVLAFWVAKDVALYPLLRRAYEPAPENAAGNLQDARGTARERLAPRGYIAVRGELWQAEVQGSVTVEAGDKVAVRGRRGLVLLVEPEDGKKRAQPPS